QEIISLLNKGGFYAKDILLGDNQEPTPFFQALIKEKQYDPLFMESNWKDTTVNDLRAVMRPLPKEQYPPNLNALKIEVSRQKRHGVVRG
ncbi:MAG: hypothetical protein ACPG80_01440, partial [Rickettsiales bacterium]